MHDSLYPLSAAATCSETNGRLSDACHLGVKRMSPLCCLNTNPCLPELWLNWSPVIWLTTKRMTII